MKQKQVQQGLESQKFCGRQSQKSCGAAVRWIGLLLLALVTPLAAHAAAPPAGTQIGNQASATYTDAAGVQRQVTSNAVLTTVQQVAALLLQQTQTKPGSVGAQVVFPHTLTNVGNGTDTFALAFSQISTDNFDLVNVHIYPDANGSGLPSSTTDITTSGPLSAGGVFHFVLVGTVPNNAAGGQYGQISVTATSAYTVAYGTNNLDTVQVSNQGVIGVTKAQSVASGTPITTNTYTLTYLNTGNNIATNVTMTDLIPTGMAYIGGSGRWSVSGAGTALSDSGSGNPAGVNYRFSAGTVSATISNVGIGITGYVTFQVAVTNTTPGIINNQAGFYYYDGGGGFQTNLTSNIVGFNVTQAAAVVIISPSFVSNVVQGATVLFTNRVVNTGAGPDTFEITYNANNYPSGTSFKLYQSDANSPLLDSDNDGIPDTGVMQPGVTNNIILRVTLPSGATNGFPYLAFKTATSHFNAGVSAVATDEVATLFLAAIDLTANSGLPGTPPGTGFGPEAVAVVTNSDTTANIATVSRFTLYVNNIGPALDTYDLSITNVLPSGWSVTFKNSGGTPISNTGPIAGNTNNVEVFADISIPAGAGAGTNNLFFQALSPTSGTKDILHAAQIISPYHAITITPNQNGQITAGGVLIYTHQVCNQGNVPEAVTLTNNNSVGTWTGLLYLDANGNNGFDTNDTPVIAPITIAAGSCTTHFVKVSAPAGATVGAFDTTTITGTSAAPTATANDGTTVIGNNLILTKLQAVDSTCGAALLADSAFTNLTLSALPGYCIQYKIVVINNGATTNTAVHVYDTLPSYTAAQTPPAAAAAGGDVHSVTITGNSFDFNVGTLPPGNAGTCTFTIKISQ